MNIVIVALAFKTRTYSAVLEILKWFAGHQIRNTAVRTHYTHYVYEWASQMMILELHMHIMLHAIAHTHTAMHTLTSMPIAVSSTELTLLFALLICNFCTSWLVVCIQIIMFILFIRHSNFAPTIYVQSIGGNICNASPISDLNPVLLACGVKLNLASKGSVYMYLSLYIHYTMYVRMYTRAFI